MLFRYPVGAAGLGLFLSFAQCPEEGWGESFGSLCDGAEVSLEAVFDGNPAGGWWKRIDGDGEGASYDEWRYLQMDEQYHPRALVQEHPRKYIKEKRGRSSVTFGCQEYGDYPLVLNGVNRSPSQARMTLAQVCNGQVYGSIPNTRRALVKVTAVENQTCLEYRTLSRKSTAGPQDTEIGELEFFCFSYDADSDQVRVSRGTEFGALESWHYRRYRPSFEGETGVDMKASSLSGPESWGTES